MSTCHACSFALDDSDNFCRRCGVPASQAQLPVVRAAAAPAMWRAPSSPVVKGAAVMVAGTIGQFVFRRVLGGMFASARGSGKQRAIRIRNRRDNDGLVDEAQIITETIMMRRVRIRRHI